MKDIRSRIVRATIVSTGPNYAVATSGGVGYHLPHSTGPVNFTYDRDGFDHNNRGVRFTMPAVNDDLALVVSQNQQPGRPRRLVSRWGRWADWEAAVRRSERELMYWFVAQGTVVASGPLREFLKTSRSPRLVSTKDPFAVQYVTFLRIGNKSLRVDQIGHWEKWDPATQKRVRCEDPRPVDPELEDRIAA